MPSSGRGRLRAALRRADAAAGRLEGALRRFGGLTVFAAAIYLLVAVLTFHHDYPGPPREPGRLVNVCGFVGHRVARGSIFLFGSASIAFYGLLAVWGGLAFLRRTFVGWLSKSIGIVAFTVALSLLLAHLRDQDASASFRRPMGWAGFVGHTLEPHLALGLGEFGTVLVVGLALAISSFLATDGVVLPFLRKRRAARGSPEPLLRFRPLEWAARVVASLRRPRRRRPLAAPAPASSAALAPAVLTPAPPKVAPPPPPQLPPADPVIRTNAPPKPSERTPRPRPPDRATRPLPFGKTRFQLPAVDLLDRQQGPRASLEREIKENATTIEQALASFRLEAKVVAAEEGPAVTMYELELAAGTKLSRLASLADDLAISLKAGAVRVVAPIPGRSTVGLEVPNSVRQVVRLRELLEAETGRRELSALPLFLGRDLGGKTLVEDLAQMPHLLIAGATGSGKSVCINSLILSLLMTRSPEECRLILIDPKMVELQAFRGIPHLLCSVVTNMRRAPGILDWACRKMDARYDLLSRSGVKHITSYNALGEKELRARLAEDFDPEESPVRLPYIVIVVDELADLMFLAAREVEASITRLAQKSRAVGIHLILATQRPSTNVITGLIKANLPTRVAFQVAAKVDSRVVLDANGAEKLLGGGDMLYTPPRVSTMTRAQGTYVSDAEIRRVVQYLAEQSPPEYAPELVQLRGDEGGGRPAEEEEEFEGPDPLFEDAVRVVVESQRGSASLLQRALSIGYTRASRLIDRMGEEGIVGRFVGSKAREVLLSPEDLARRRGGGGAQAGSEAPATTVPASRPPGEGSEGVQ
jgi:S-DNA-T family DNA segregation ATPase FtsK/SpoIIIE